MTRALWKAALNLEHEACPHQGGIKLEVRRPDSHSTTGPKEEQKSGKHMESQGDSPGSEEGHWPEEDPAPTQRPGTQLRDKSHHFSLSYLWATLNTCLPRGTHQGPRDTNTDTCGHASTQAVWGLKNTPKPAVNHCPQKAPVAAPQKSLKHWGRVVSDSRIFSTQAWKNKVSLLKDIIKKNSCYFSSYLSTGCAVNDFQVTIAL